MNMLADLGQVGLWLSTEGLEAQLKVSDESSTAGLSADGLAGLLAAPPRTLFAQRPW